MQLCNLHLRLAPRRRAVLLDRFSAAACYTTLHELAERLRGHPWMVVSGLVEPLCRGRFTRAHSDLDIALPLEGLAAGVAGMLSAGYILTRRVLRTRVARDADFEAHLRIGPHDAAPYRHLRLWRTRPDGGLDESRFPAYVDIYPYVIEAGHLRLVHSGQRAALRQPLVHTVRLPGGIPIPVENPYYLPILHKSGPEVGYDPAHAERRAA